MKRSLGTVAALTCLLLALRAEEAKPAAAKPLAGPPVAAGASRPGVSPDRQPDAIPEPVERVERPLPDPGREPDSRPVVAPTQTGDTGNVAVAAAKPPVAERFAGEIKAFRAWDSRNAIPANPVLFIGSSTIRLWRTAEAFPDLPVMNRGFGGAQFRDLLQYKQDVLLRYPAPACIVLYCGDNDIASGRTAAQVLADFAELHRASRAAFPTTPLVFMAIKPSPSRWKIWPEQKRANELIAAHCAQDPLARFADIAAPLLATGSPPAESLFVQDKLHLNDEGYRLCAAVVRPIVAEVLKRPAP